MERQEIAKKESASWVTSLNIPTAKDPSGTAALSAVAAVTNVAALADRRQSIEPPLQPAKEANSWKIASLVPFLSRMYSYAGLCNIALEKSGSSVPPSATK